MCWRGLFTECSDWFGEIKDRGFILCVVNWNGEISMFKLQV